MKPGTMMRAYAVDALPPARRVDDARLDRDDAIAVDDQAAAGQHTVGQDESRPRAGS